ncbi:hypothetical protein JRQ81_011965 [Phrynocephalus forsythii]|uniref:Uncharacterized protein n=1 Tax=Phrynocephalus forsythii TaxID=171643 RepID=A0A9Q1AQM0_9SAUR|nr:hypothetical protein JRQ81_011965 [Phrynocephalus forsythii]
MREQSTVNFTPFDLARLFALMASFVQRFIDVQWVSMTAPSAALPDSLIQVTDLYQREGRRQGLLKIQAPKDIASDLGKNRDDGFRRLANSAEATDSFSSSDPPGHAMEEAGQPAPGFLLQPQRSAGLLDQPPEALPGRQHVALPQKKVAGPPWEHWGVRRGIHLLAERRSIQAQSHVEIPLAVPKPPLPGQKATPFPVAKLLNEAPEGMHLKPWRTTRLAVRAIASPWRLHLLPREPDEGGRARAAITRELTGCVFPFQPRVDPRRSGCWICLKCLPGSSAFLDPRLKLEINVRSMEKGKLNGGGGGPISAFGYLVPSGAYSRCTLNLQTWPSTREAVVGWDRICSSLWRAKLAVSLPSSHHTQEANVTRAKSGKDLGARRAIRERLVFKVPRKAGKASQGKEELPKTSCFDPRLALKKKNDA